MSNKTTTTNSCLPASNQGSRSVSAASRKNVKPTVNILGNRLSTRSKSIIPTTSRCPLGLTEQRQGNSPAQLGLPISLRKASSMCSVPNAGNTSMDNLSISKNEKAVGDKAKGKFELHRPRMNLAAQQRMEKCRMPKSDGQGDKLTVFSFGPSLKNTPTFQPASSHQENIHKRIIESSRIRNFETLHRKLEDLQSNFFNKLRSLGPNELSYTVGRYKFVSLVTNSEMKVMLHEDDMFRLPKHLPTESVNDLKDRSAAVVEAGFAILYEAIPQIQLARNEVESLNFREELRKKLQTLMNRRIMEISVEIHELCKAQQKSGCPDVARLYQEIADLRIQKKQAENKYYDSKKEHAEQLGMLQRTSAATLTSEVCRRDNEIAELTKNVERLEIYLADRDDLLAKKNAALEELEKSQNRLLDKVNDQQIAIVDLTKRLAVASENWKSSAATAQQKTECVECLDSELKEARELIASLQRTRPDALDRGIQEKELILSDLKLQLQNMEKHKNLLMHQVSNMMKREAQNELQLQYEEAQCKISALQAELAEKEEVIAEFSKLQPNLQAELDHSQEKVRRLNNAIVCLQEKAQLDKQLLHARSEMIAAMQLHGQEVQKAMEERLKKMKIKFYAQDVALRTLLNSLTIKQMELHRQEHLIKLLEESNDRKAELSALHEQQNAEISHLKRTVLNYEEPQSENPKNSNNSSCNDSIDWPSLQQQASEEPSTSSQSVNQSQQRQ